MKKTQSKIKPIKHGKKPGTTYCLGCKDYTDNFKPQEVKLTNKKHTGNTFPKKLVLISKNKVKGKSKCAICLTERTFIHETEGNMIQKVN